MSTIRNMTKRERVVDLIFARLENIVPETAAQEAAQELAADIFLTLNISTEEQEKP